MASEDFSEIIRLLLKYPMTVEMIFRSSKNFTRSYASIGTLRNRLNDMHGRGLLGRQEVPSVGNGRKPFLYFPSRRIKRIPEFSELELPNAAFRGFSGSFWHSEATSEFMSYLERSAGEAGDLVRILATVRDGYFKVPLNIEYSEKKQNTSLIPDSTIVVSLDGSPSLLFLEMLHSPAVINPMSPQSIARSFRFQMAKYKVFKQHFRKNPDIRAWEDQFNCCFCGFRVLVVTKKGETQKSSLLNLAKMDGYRTLFCFSILDEISAGNIFTDPIWNLPNGQERELI